jgi:pimeloyl-ACP methyl ester carboxylesterase
MPTAAQDLTLTTARYETGYGPGRVLRAGPTTGLPVVLIHGYAASAAQWQPLLPYLAGERPVLAPDLLGFAEAPTPPPPYTAERWADQVARLLDALALPRAIVIGHSLGGLVALTAALRYPDRVAGLGLIASLGLPPAPGASPWRGFSSLGLRLLGAPGVGEAVFLSVRGQRRLAAAMALGAYHDPARAPADAVDAWHALINRPGAHRAYIGVVRRLRHLTAPLRPGLVTQPTAIVWGANDRGLPASLAREFQRLIPQADVTIIPATGHVPHSEQPAATAAALAGVMA